MPPDHNAPPLNPLPMVVWGLFLPMLAVEVVLQLGTSGLVGGPEAIGWRILAVQDFGFYSQLLPMMAERGQYPPNLLMRFVTYAFVNGSFSQFLFAAVFLLALGKMVGEVFRAWAVAVVFFGASIFGALVYGMALGDAPPLIGGFPAVYGMIGAFTYILWMNLSHQGANPYRAFSLIGMLLGIQLLFGALFGAAPDWIAELAGFVAGFGLSFVVSPGGWSRIVQKLRTR